MIREGKTFQVPSLMQAGQARACRRWTCRSSAWCLEKKFFKCAIEKANDEEFLQKAIAKIRGQI